MCLAVNPPPFDKGGKGVGGFRGIVRFGEGWWSGNGWCDNPSGSRPNFFGRQHLTFDKGGKGDGAKQGKGVGGFRGIVRFCDGWVRNEGLLTEVSKKRKGYGKCGNPSGSRPNFFGRQHLTFDKGRAWMPEVERPKFR